MLVPMPFVGGMEMAVMQIIDVVAMGDGDMTAMRAVHVIMS